MDDARGRRAAEGRGAERRALRVAVLLARPTDGLPGRGEENHESAGADAADRVLLAAARGAGLDAFVVPVGLDDVARVVEGLECDVVLNLCDGSGADRDGLPGLEALAALDRRGLPYTGARAPFYAIGSDKAAMKRRFAAVGVPTPAWQVFLRADDPLGPGLEGGELFVKPRDSGASIGIDLESVVTSTAALRARVAAVCATFGEALVERYIDGREITIGVLDGPGGPRVLPPLEVLFGPAFPRGRGIRTFASKHMPDSGLYHDMSIRCPAALPGPLARRLQELARAAYVAVEGSGYGRVDLRLDARGEPFVLEVNPACSLEWSETSVEDCAMFPLAARASGLEFGALLRALVDEALRRAHGEPSAVATVRPCGAVREAGRVPSAMS